MLNIIDDVDDSVHHIIQSPGFSMKYPDLVNKALMPADVLMACEWAWNHKEFSDRQVYIRRYECVFVTNQGLIVREHDHAVYRSSITQHTMEDVELGIYQLQQALRENRCHQQTGQSGLCYKPGHDNYGHWLIEMLPKAAMYRDHVDGRDLAYIVPPHHGRLGTAISDSLNMLSIDPTQVIAATEPMWCEVLYNVVGLTHHGVFMSPLVFGAIEEIASNIEAESAERIYVTRRGRVRGIEQEKEFKFLLEENGFITVDPADVNLRKQIALFKGARHIVGAMGAGMSNVVFSQNGACVTTLSPAQMADTFYWFICGLCGHKYREIRCPVTGPAKGIGDRDRDMDVLPKEVFGLIL